MTVYGSVQRNRKKLFCLAVEFLVFLFLPKSIQCRAQTMVNEKRCREIEKLLLEKPAGPGRPASDRSAWEKLSRDDFCQKVLAQAEQLVHQPIPEQPEELYLEFSRTGLRRGWENVAFARRDRIKVFTLAECLENKGRFLQPLEAVIKAVCAERTWVYPAHDQNLDNFYGRNISIDLGSSALAWQLATADYLLGDKLSPEIRRLVRERVQQFIFTPYREILTGKRGPYWWLKGTNNWNSVCLAGVTGAALALLDSRSERALFVAAAEELSRNFLRGFTADGYCSEGLGYWNYGFGHYVLLSETIRQATGGRIDLLSRPEVPTIARFGAEIEIINRVYPAFADCPVKAQPDGVLMSFLSRRFSLKLKDWEKTPFTAAVKGQLPEAAFYPFCEVAESEPGQEDYRLPLRSFFPQAGVLICRPSSYPFAVALKGGHNQEHHNHNDVGSYVVVVGEVPIIVDPGNEEYTARTFSRRRYESQVLNSYGHSVPLVAGQLQQTGRSAQGKILKTSFTDEEDSLLLDLKSAYAVPELKELTRGFFYSRKGKGKLTVTDRVRFDPACQFGTAIITSGSYRVISPAELVLTKDKTAVRVTIVAEAGQVEIVPEVLRDGSKPTRIGINFTQPVREGNITLVMEPL